MAATDPKVQKSIDKLVLKYQELADEEKSRATRREAARKEMDTVLDEIASMESFDKEKVTPEKTGAFLAFIESVQTRLMTGDFSAQLEMMRFNQGFMDGLNEHLNAVKQDVPTYRRILTAKSNLSADLKPSILKPGEPQFGIAVTEPDGDHGTWSFTFVAFAMDENFKVGTIDKLDLNVSVSMEVVRPTTDSLSGKFNIPAQYTKAGDKFEPLTVQVETKPNEPLKMLSVKGYLSNQQGELDGLKVPLLYVRKAGGMKSGFDGFDDGFGSSGPTM